MTVSIDTLRRTLAIVQLSADAIRAISTEAETIGDTLRTTKATAQIEADTLLFIISSRTWNAEGIMRYLPPYYQESRVMRAIAEAQGREIGKFWATLDEILRQFFVETATDWGLSLWEQMLGLPDYTGNPLEQRRSRIISKLRGYGTATVELIKSITESYVYGTAEVIEHPEVYSFTIKFVDLRGTPPNLDDLKAIIEEIKPAHLAVEYQFSYTVWGELNSWGKTWGELNTLGLTWGDLMTWRP